MGSASVDASGGACARHRRLGVAATTLAALIILLGLVGTARAATFTVTVGNDPSGPGCGPFAGPPGQCSLRQAIAAAASGDIVVLPSALSPYTLTQGARSRSRNRSSSRVEAPRAPSSTDRATAPQMP